MIFGNELNIILKVLLMVIISTLPIDARGIDRSLLEKFTTGRSEQELHNQLLNPILESAQELALRTFYCEGDNFTKTFVRLKALELTTTPADMKKLLSMGSRMPQKFKRNTRVPENYPYSWEEAMSFSIIAAAEEATIADMIAREMCGEEFSASEMNEADMKLLERPFIDVANAYVEAIKALRQTFNQPGNVNVEVFRDWLNDWFVQSPLMFRQALYQVRQSAVRMASDRKYRRYYMNRIMTGIWFYVDITIAAQKLFGEYRTGFDDVYPEMYDKFLHSMNSTFIEDFNSFYHRPSFMLESPTDGPPGNVTNRMLEYSFRGVFALREPMRTCFLGVIFSSMHDSCFRSIVNTGLQEMILVYKLITMYLSMKSAQGQ
ncbi:HHR084Cp [Eremothecium sinecaudum]|uniref:HHR084Cp n=1 Tax=Eremothecium sinecaudum TaxID=45286 RepID=A0A0X8HWS4_9SACH|nr:HHR084Cp [Eremothecium sinecaudum]AMD22853.1 HHR084Cp [Eremothecium sinecaudum]